MGFFDNKNAMEAAGEQVEETMQETESNESKVVSLPKRRPFTIWDVCGSELKLKLTTDAIERLEQKYKTNLMNVVSTNSGGMPALTVMLDVTHEATKKYQHGISRKDISDMFERYVDNGGSQLNFYTEVYMEIFKVSGFFSESLTDQMDDAMQDVKEIL